MKKQADRITLSNKILRVLWGVVRLTLYRFSPAPLHGWRRFLLRLFGAKVGAGAHPYPSARVWAPWNLEMGVNSCLSHDVDCYSVARIVLGENAIVSQKSYLCAATKDYQDPSFPLLTAPIEIRDQAWIAADAFVGPGVVVGEGAVVGARACVFKDVEPWTVVSGNPAQFVKQRRRHEAPDPLAVSHK